MTDRVLRIGQLGCGIVGSAVLRMLEANAHDIEQRTGARLEIGKVAVRSLEKDRDIPDAAKKLLTTSTDDVVSDPSIDIVVEVMGGVEPTLGLMLRAISAGKPLVTANKELLASRGRELFDAADAAGVDLYFEAAVAGGIPIIHPLKESLAGERIRKVMGIVNGTTNFILTRMTELGESFGEALSEAERRGFTELDPTADIEGFDPAAKAAILASIAFNTRVVASDVYREGIAEVTAQDIANAKKLGYIVKLLAIAEEEDGEVTVRVHPSMIPLTHPLASVRENLNAVFVEGENVGELMFYGRGAGGPPTATSVVGDIVDVARNKLSGGRGVSDTCYENKPIRTMEGMVAQYYMLLSVADRPGVLAAVAGAFGENNVSIQNVWQEGLGDQAQLVLITHRAQEKNMQATLAALRELDAVTKVASVMRVEGGEE
ncbi:MAG: homoserine dehydrogenase [Actinomycetota bacterium]|nr:homoserine dehydrogenase [Actinomycetota bacterium]